MADNSLPVNAQGVMEPENINALMQQTRGQLVSKFPLLNANPEFQQEFTDVFSRFVNQGTQKGSDYDALYNQIIAPFAQKWSALGTQQTGLMDLQANQVARQTGSPTAAMQMFPQLLAPGSDYRANWQSRLAQEDKLAAMNRKPTLQQQDTREFLKRNAANILANTPANPNDDQKAALDNAEKAVSDYDRQVQASLTPPRVLQPSIPSATGVAPAPGAMSVAPTPGLVAAPQGTSGYVDYSRPLSEQRGISYIGPALSPAAEAAYFHRTPQTQAVIQSPSDVPAPAAASSGPALLIDPSTLAVNASELRDPNATPTVSLSDTTLEGPRPAAQPVTAPVVNVPTVRSGIRGGVRRGPAAIPPAAIEMLKSDPKNLSASFDDKYGQGTAAFILGQ